MSIHLDMIVEDEASRLGVEPSDVEEANASPEFVARFTGMKDALDGKRAVPPSAHRPFSTLAAHYLETRQRDGSGDKVKGVTEAHLASVYRLFSSHIDDGPMSSVTPHIVSTFFDKLRKLDVNWGRSPATKQRTLSELLKISASSDAPRLSDKTLFRHMSGLSQLWKWAKTRGEATGDNPFAGQVKKPSLDPAKTKQRRPNLPWTDDAIRAYFRLYPDVSRPGRPEAMHWVPRIALLSGMRLNEVCSLEVSDIKTGDEGIRFFDITEAKSSAGIRQVPLHDDLSPLLSLAPSHGLLFPEMKPSGPDGKLSANFGKRFGRARRAIPGAGTFHGQRHNATGGLERSHTPESEAAQIVGHGKKRGFTYTVYSDGLTLPQKLEIVRRIQLPPGALQGRGDDHEPTPVQ